MACAPGSGASLSAAVLLASAAGHASRSRRGRRRGQSVRCLSLSFRLHPTCSAPPTHHPHHRLCATMSSSSQSQLASALNDAASKPTSTRTQAYQEILVSLLEQPRSSLSAEALVQACSDYLDTTVFSDLNSSGGGLVVGRNTLTAFDEAIKKAGHAPAEAMQGDDEQAKPAIQDEEVQKEILEAALAKVQPRVLSFEEQVSWRSVRRYPGLHTS